MKFGRRLLHGLKEKHWEEHYVDYDKLKAQVRQISDAPPYDQPHLVRGLISDLRKQASHVDTYFFATLSKLEASLSSCRCGMVVEEARINSTLAIYTTSNAFLLERKESSLSNTISLDRDYCHHHSLHKHIIRLVSSKEHSWDETDPFVVGNIALESHIQEYVNIFQQVRALRRLAIVNNVALEKLVKKIVRHISRDVIPTSLFSSLALKCNDSNAKDRLQTLHTHLQQIDDDVLVCSTSVHEYITSLGVQYMAQHLDHKTLQRERGLIDKGETTTLQIASLTNFRNNLKPSYVLIFQTIISTLTLLTTYTLSNKIFVDEQKTRSILEEKGYFISASMDMSPASHVGTLGLTMVTFGLLFTVFVRHKMMKRLLHGRSMLLHRLSITVAITSIFCGLGVAAFQHHLYTIVHNLFAALFFLLGVLHIVLEVYLETIYELYDPFHRKTRQFIVFLTLLSVAFFLLLLAFAGDMGSKNYDQTLFVAAIAELAAFFLFLLYFLTFLPGFHQLDMHLVLMEPPTHTQKQVDLLSYIKEKVKEPPPLLHNGCTNNVANIRSTMAKFSSTTTPLFFTPWTSISDKSDSNPAKDMAPIKECDVDKPSKQRYRNLHD
eukprot:m.14213 g.14213  ORF g.14213 m.14213 type:complete len:607 (-) comp4274_c0_seq2:364-2184(-)